MAKSAKAAVGYQYGRLVEQSGGMVDAVVHPALLKDNEARLLKNASISEKGTVKTTRGRQERFASPFDADNPCNGLTAFYPDTSTSRLVMGAGTKLYSDTPHLIESWDNEPEWNTWSASGMNKTGGTLKIDEKNGIETIGTETTTGSGSAQYEMGWKFTVGPAPVVLYGLRLKGASTGNVTARLWKVSDSSKLEEIIIPAVTDTWLKKAFAAPCILEAGASYVVSIGVPTNTNYKTVAKSGVTFHAGITCDGGMKTTAAGSYPDTADAATIYGVVDLVMSAIQPTVHTTKADWDAQVLSQVDTDASPGDVKLAKQNETFTYTETTQADFQSGTLTDVVATSAGDLELAKETIDSYTKLLLHMDGADNGTTFTDECGKTVTRYGAVTKTGEKKFGAASGFFDGVDDYLSIPSSTDFDFGTGDFTIECWFKLNSLPGTGKYPGIISRASGITTATQWSICFNPNGAGINFNVMKSDGNFYNCGPDYNGNLAVDTWYHFALVGSGTTSNGIKMYLNGNLVASSTSRPNLETNNVSKPINVSYYHYNNGFANVYIDELRISKGVARWTSNFTPPTVPYANYKSSGTREKIIDLSGANPAGGTKIEWAKTTPAGTSIKVETALSTDGGATYGAWQEATSGSGIPGIASDTDLSNARLKIKETLSTTDTSKTPQLHSLTLSLTAGYESTGNYLSPALPLLVSRGTLKTSEIAWMVSGTVKVEADIYLDGAWQGWQECTSGGIIPVLPEELSDGKIRYRITLSTTDPLATPTFEQISMLATAEVPEVRYWQPGQIVNINLPDRGVQGEYLIQRVTISPTWSSPSIWTYRVEYGGRLLGIADFLKALVSAQQKKRNIEPSNNVQKYIYGEETLQVADELITTTRALPYVCGDPDAICGLVVVSNG